MEPLSAVTFAPLPQVVEQDDGHFLVVTQDCVDRTRDSGDRVAVVLVTDQQVAQWVEDQQRWLRQPTDCVAAVCAASDRTDAACSSQNAARSSGVRSPVIPSTRRGIDRPATGRMWSPRRRVGLGGGRALPDSSGGRAWSPCCRLEVGRHRINTLSGLPDYRFMQPGGKRLADDPFVDSVRRHV